ncbi:ubiquitin-like protein 4A [Tribolium castaneum]|uniref:Ubiquitin-like protein 4A n=1 Tax=Tribolium castaneum TaxID=7070 RepID=D6WYC0_TRICA|nr:PREDICTED: ubiquitin-like protein 4A [Tribolium castaneum]EFA09130.1 Ubiquitin-like protein 4A [Tribolium castaneum]|eukprot:XP_967620.1 PREDICTED: ubiquitin-like protein 4A [Tribolium castaneum]
MKILIKSIRGGSCMVDAQETTTILELKKKVATDINIPVAQQTMVVCGKTLQDDKTVGSYPNLKDGAKIYVAVKKPDTLKAALTRFLRQYYSDQQCSAIVDEFMKDFQNKVNNLSLDDLERIAKADMDNST